MASTSAAPDSVEIISSREVSDDSKKSKILGKKAGGSYTLYCIQCVSGSKKWVVEKRYSEFAGLEKELKASGCKAVHLLSMPKKKLLGRSTSAKVVANRELDLSEWLSVIVRRARSEPAMRAFLDDSQNAAAPTSAAVSGVDDIASGPVLTGSAEVEDELLAQLGKLKLTELQVRRH